MAVRSWHGFNYKSQNSRKIHLEEEGKRESENGGFSFSAPFDRRS